MCMCRAWLMDPALSCHTHPLSAERAHDSKFTKNITIFQWLLSKRTIHLQKYTGGSGKKHMKSGDQQHLD
jgi:hypothetical protein